MKKHNFKSMRKEELIAELEKHYGTVEAVTVTHSRDCVEILWPLVKRSKKHAVAIMYIDGANTLLESEVITKDGVKGLNDSDYRRIFRKAIKLSCASIITGHKVFEPYTKPETDDFEELRKLLKNSQIIGIELLDHVVMHKNGHYSYHGNGKI